MTMKTPAQTWQIGRSKKQPKWTHVGGNLDVDEQCFPDGYWLVLEEGRPHVMFLSPEQYAAWQENNQ